MTGKENPSGHKLESVMPYADLMQCAVCQCAEGTLPTECPGREVPMPVQEQVMVGVVDFVDGRWIGKRKGD